MTGERSVEELIADADNTPAGTVSAALAAIRSTASADGVTVTVDLYGKLVDLRLDRCALTGAAELTALIRRLAGEATARAGHEATAVLTGIAALADTALVARVGIPATPDSAADPALSVASPAGPEPDAGEGVPTVTCSAW